MVGVLDNNKVYVNQAERSNQVPQPALMASNSILTIAPYKHRKDLTRESVLSKYLIIGYIAAGTYGKVYKAKSKTELTSRDKEVIEIDGGDDGKTKPIKNLKDINDEEVNKIMDSKINELSNKNEQNNNPTLFAIKKFKSDNHLNKSIYPNNEIIHYTGISQSAIREMSICRELNHKNITKLIDIILENKSIYMIFEFFEHDLLQIIHFHSHPEINPIPESTIKSLIWQVLNGVTFLHKNWIFHRDLKPANIMVSSNGVVKIGDLGLARKFNNNLQSLYTGDKVVVTIWYRAPELLLGTRHYSPAIDLWAVGCILAELLLLRPIFKGEEAKLDLNNKKSIPFQKNQLQKIIEILGTPNINNWPALCNYPEYSSFQQVFLSSNSTVYPNNLLNWYNLIGGKNKQCLSLLKSLLEYDPLIRSTADDALVHPFFLELPKVNSNAFEGLSVKYPNRRIYTDDNDILSNGKIVNNNPNAMNQMQNQKSNFNSQLFGNKRLNFNDTNQRKRQR